LEDKTIREREQFEGSTCWSNNDELKFLMDLPKLMQNSFRASGTPPSRQEILDAYSKYLSALDLRAHWGSLKRKSLRESVKRCLKRYENWPIYGKEIK
jgi:hypothetical protein